MTIRIPMLRVLLLTAAFVGAGCSDLFDVENPGSLTVDDLEDPELLGALAISGEAEVCDSWDNMVDDNGNQADDATFIGSFTYNELHMWGHMEGFNSVQNLNYNAMASARWIAEEVVVRLEAASASSEQVANARYWGAFARVALADHFQEVPIDLGPPQAPDVILEGALALFAQVASSSSNTTLRAGALATRARVNRSLYFERGQDISFFASAMNDAQQALAIDNSFSLNCRYAQPGSTNNIAGYHRSIVNDVIDPRIAVLVDPVTGVRDDVRIPIGPAEALAPPPHTGNVHRFFKYPTLSSPLPVSRWQEARLILAEGHLLNGDLVEAVNEINLVRAAVPLAAFQGTTAPEIDVQLKYERQVEFILEGRRLQDHRYYNIIPWQWDDLKKQAGTNRRWPVSTEEIAANPNYQSPG